MRGVIERDDDDVVGGKREWMDDKRWMDGWMEKEKGMRTEGGLGHEMV